MIQSVIRFQVAAIKRNPVVFLFVILIACISLYIGFRHGAIKQAIAYISVMWLCSLIIDMWAIGRPVKDTFIVRNPKRETSYFLACAGLGLLFFYVRLSGAVNWDHLPPLLKLALIPLILFVFPVGLAIIMLLLRYKPRDLGIRLQGFLPALIIIALSFLANRLVDSGHLTWKDVVTESGGVLATLYSGFILAGLSEEFFRVIGQTRIGALLHNKGAGWAIATVIWAVMHGPKWYADSHDFAETMLSCLRIIPIGLMWGYLTHRTKSIIPAVLVHGTNYSGLQNF